MSALSLVPLGSSVVLGLDGSVSSHHQPEYVVRPVRSVLALVSGYHRDSRVRDFLLWKIRCGHERDPKKVR